MTPDELFQWIHDEQGVDRATLTEVTPLFSSGLLDSLAMVDLLAFIEERGDIRVRWTELTLERMDSVRAVLDFVALKQRG